MASTPYTNFDPERSGTASGNTRGGGGGQKKETDKLVAVQQKTAEVADVVRANIEAVIDRGVKIDALEEKSQALEEQSVVFNKKSAAVKRHMCWQSWKMLILLLVIVAVIIIILYFAITKGKS